MSGPKGSAGGSASAAATFVKICGLRTLDDALACAAAGADAVGFNFWRGSKRFVEIDKVAGFALPPGLRRFGVFVDPDPAEVERAFASGAIEIAQLHGDESPELCARFAGRYVKAIRLRDQRSLALLDDYDCELLLVDADAPGYGGSGRAADRALARQAAERRKVLLAGGLTPDNVGAAIAEVRPFGVDVAGGVESAPGVKDHAAIARFIHAARGVR